MISQQMEEYLEAIGKLEERGEAVTTSALARECRVAPPTVTEMLGRLASQGLIHYEPRKEISLTDEGRSLSTTVIRRHRLWERFLHDVLGLRWDQVHDEACQLEHATSPELERRLARALGGAAACPHGHTIPDTVDEARPVTTVPLSDLSPSTEARVVSVSEDGALLRRLQALKIKPGAVVRVEAVPPGEDTLTLTVAGERQTLEMDEASRVAVAVLPAGEVGRGPGSGGAFPLGDLMPGERASVHGFQAGRGLVGRCLALGFTPGAQVRMIQNIGQGPVIVLVRDTRVALGRGEAQKILVSRKEDNHGDTN